MATLKVYSNEYGVRKVQEKVKLYSLRSTQQKNDVIISEKQKDNNEQKVIINDLSSYERVKKIAETMGMKTQKDNIKVVR